jgi:hypothetical protein
VTSVRLLVLFIPLLSFSGCNTETSTEPSLPPGPAIARITITGRCSDEYGRDIGFASGSISIWLSGTGVGRSAILTPASPVAVFDNLPLQRYEIIESRESCYTVTSSVTPQTRFYQLAIGPYLSLRPDTSFRVDSLSCLINAITPRVFVYIHYGSTLPSGGRRTPVLFAGLSASVSPRYGDYVFCTEFADGSPSIFLTGDMYPELQWAGFAPGEQVYLTCRLKTGGTRSETDPMSGLQVYSGLETNTTATTSFVMP